MFLGVHLVPDRCNLFVTSSNWPRQTASYSSYYCRRSLPGSLTGRGCGIRLYTSLLGRFGLVRPGLPSIHPATFLNLQIGSCWLWIVLVIWFSFLGVDIQWIGGYLRVDEIAFVLIVCIEDLEGGFLVAFTESFLPVELSDVYTNFNGYFIPDSTYQPSPKFIAPRHSGLTLTPAVGARRR
jgi:hypothetical protein